MRKTAGRFEAGKSSFEATGDPAMAIPAFIGQGGRTIPAAAAAPDVFSGAVQAAR